MELQYGMNIMIYPIIFMNIEYKCVVYQIYLGVYLIALWFIILKVKYNDASIKKLSNIYITIDGYPLNGTLIGFDILDNAWSDATWIDQNKGKLYCRYIKHYGDGSGTGAGTENHYANIVYI